MIEVQNLTKRYGEITAVNNLSFEVKKGEVLGFLGPNGAGKTTTMRILTGFLPATSGIVKVAGYDIMQQPMEVKRRIGYLPENPPLYTDMTVRSYLKFVGKIKGVLSADLNGRIDWALQKCGLVEVEKRVIANLSKGFKQRVGLAQAILHKPEVLILDEPTVGLDPKQIREIRELIKELAGEHTVILSTHILPEVSMTCKNILIINRGHIVAQGTVDSVTKGKSLEEVFIGTISADVEAMAGGK
jgi:ABC-2 type transport system ATP-binding protein